VKKDDMELDKVILREAILSQYSAVFWLKVKEIWKCGTLLRRFKSARKSHSRGKIEQKESTKKKGCQRGRLQCKPD